MISRIAAKIFVFVFVVVSAPGISFAQLDSAFGGSDKPVAISADEGIEWNREEKFFIANGNAQAAQGDFFISASSLKAFYNEIDGGNPDVWKVVANGGVYAKRGTDELFGDEIEYLVKEERARMTGRQMFLESQQGVLSATDYITFDRRAQRAEAAGNTSIVQGKNIVVAEKLIAYFTGADGATDLSKVEAIGKVKLTDGENYAQSDRATYNTLAEIASLSGNVSVTQGLNEMTGDFAEVNFRTGHAQVRSERGKRIFILIDPKSTSNSPTFGTQ